MRLTNEALAAIEKRAEAATPGPWTIEPAAGTDTAGKPATWKTVGRPIHAVDDDVDDDRTHVSDLDDCVSEADAGFIAAARSDVPALLAEIRELRRELAETRSRNFVTTVRCGSQGPRGPGAVIFKCQRAKGHVGACGDCYYWAGSSPEPTAKRRSVWPPCPRCGAAEGAECKSNRGLRTKIHNARIEGAARKGRP